MSGEFNYQRYLASRKWAVLREKVRERSGNRCERCYERPQQAVHHLTYERVGEELLEDLQAVCNPCHEFLSGKADVDPAQDKPSQFSPLITTGLDDLDRSLGGGVECGELVVLASRPGHQPKHFLRNAAKHWQNQGLKVACCSRRNLGGCRTGELWLLEEMVLSEGVNCAIVDYPRITLKRGEDYYAATEIALEIMREIASENNMLLILTWPMTAAIEYRKKFVPRMDDLVDKWAVERNADVIMFSVNPNVIDKSYHQDIYQFFIGKNSSRGIDSVAFECQVKPDQKQRPVFRQPEELTQ